MLRGMSVDRITGESGPAVDMMNAVLFVRFRLPCVETIFTTCMNSFSPEQ